MIIVCPLSKVQALVDEHRVRDVVSLLGPDTPHRSFDGVTPERHLRLTFHDIIEPVDGFTAPHSGDARRIIGFLSDHHRAAPLLIHCWAGISRSTATAFTALCLFNPGADEEELALNLRLASPSATPNRRLVALADAELGRGGRMVRAIDRIGRGAEAFEGVPFFL